MTRPVTALDRPPEEAAEDTSFARGLRLLLTIADRGAVRADELGTALEMPVSTVYRYLRTLAEFGFVERRGGGYHLGPRLLIGDGANVSSERLLRHAGPVLDQLAADTGETAVVVRRIGLTSVCLHQVESEELLRVTLEPGTAHAALRRRTRSRAARVRPIPGARGGAGPGPRARHAPDAHRGRAPGEPRRDRHDRHGHERGRAHRGLRGHRRAGLPGRRHRRCDRIDRAGHPMRPAWRKRAGRLLQDAARTVNVALAESDAGRFSRIMGDDRLIA